VQDLAVSKRCSKCNQDLPVECFCVQRANKDNRDFYCRRCRADYRQHRKTRLRHVVPEKKRCHECNQDLDASRFGVNKASKDGLFNFCRQCRAKRRKSVGTDALKAERREQYLRYFKTASAKCNYLLKKARHRAEKKGIPFSLTREWAMERLEGGKCELTGIPFVFDTPWHPFTPSIDRIDPRRPEGYAKGHARMILWLVNAAKGNSPDEVFIPCLKQVAEAILRAS
jgi:hypothetical protein